MARLTVLTVVAGVWIAFHGPLPHSIFDFNVGVLRWTWRVQLYAFTLATDRYPPFSLREEPDFPARLEVEYPDQLSRGLVSVKWWLLAIPQYLVVAAFNGGAGLHLGLIGVLSVIAGVTLAVTGQYPTSIFSFVMGLHRWSWRVLCYAALMRDDYRPSGSTPARTSPMTGQFPVRWGRNHWPPKRSHHGCQHRRSEGDRERPDWRTAS